MDCFYTVLEKNSNQILYQDEKINYTYAQLWDDISRARVYLKTQGIQEKQRVPVSYKNPIHFLVSFYTVISLGACVVLVETGKKMQEISDIAKQIGCSFILSDHLDREQLQEYGIRRIEFCLECLPAEKNNEIKCDMDAEGCIIYTSGSTSKPKGVIRTNYILFKHSEMLKKVYNLGCEDRVLSLVMPHHAFGLENILAAVYSGATLSILNEFSHTKVMQYIEKKQCTIMVAVPFHYDLLVSVKKKAEKNRLRYMLAAGAPLKKEVNAAINRLLGIPITQIYGSSELGATAINSPKEKWFDYEAVGLPFPGVKIQIMDEDKKILPHKQVGEIVINSPFRTIGYVDYKDDKNGVHLENEWFFTGDLGYINDCGLLFITGRKKNIMNIAGKKVSPEEVEHVIKNMENIEDVKVEGRYNTLYGETIVAHVVVKKGAFIPEYMIFKYCREYLSDYKVPRQIVFTDKLAYTSNGKLKR